MTIWRNTLAVVHEYRRRIGQPVGGADVVLFFNHCEQSAFGIHKDTLENITFVIQGRKRFLTWPYELLQELGGRSDNGRWSNATIPAAHYDELLRGEYRRRATVIEAGPGDVIYLPTSHWHVAEWQEGDVPPATLSVAFGLHAFNHRGSLALSEAALRRLEERESVIEAPAVYRYPLDEDVGRALAEMDRFARRIMEDPLMHRETEERRLAWLTGFGFADVPPPLPAVPLADEDVLQIDPRFPVVWKVYGPDDVICSVHGQVLGCSEPFLPLLRDLNRGVARSVGSLVAEHAAPESLAKDELVEALQELVSVRALHLL